MKQGRRILVLLLWVLCSIHTMGQTEYYYYPRPDGQKVSLTLNDSKVGLIVLKENKELIEYIKANVQKIAKGRDDVVESFFITRTDYEKLTSLDTWEEDSKSVLVTRSFISRTVVPRGVEVVETGIIKVRLKKEEDVDLLHNYMEKYKLRLSRHWAPSSPLSYSLAITFDSGIGALECANALYETGDFAYSCPELGAAPEDYLDQTYVRKISTPPTENSSAVFDLQGRLSGKPVKGVYIENGRKMVK